MEYYWYLVIFFFLLSIGGLIFMIYFRFNFGDMKEFFRSLCQKCSNCCRQKGGANVGFEYDDEDFYNML